MKYNIFRKLAIVLAASMITLPFSSGLAIAEEAEFQEVEFQEAEAPEELESIELFEESDEQEIAEPEIIDALHVQEEMEIVPEVTDDMIVESMEPCLEGGDEGPEEEQGIWLYAQEQFVSGKKNDSVQLSIVAASPQSEIKSFTWYQYDAATGQKMLVCENEADPAAATEEGEFTDSIPVTVNGNAVYECEIKDAVGCTESAVIEVRMLEGEGAPDKETAKTLPLGEKETANICNSDEWMFFKVIPEVSGTYLFYSESNWRVSGELVEENEEEDPLAQADGNNNFQFSYNLIGGKTYYLKSRFVSHEEVGSFWVGWKKTEIPECKHNFNSSHLEIESDCTKVGKRVFKCSYCGETKEQEEPKTGHRNSGVWTVLQNASCTQKGRRVQKCLVCGAVCKTEEIQAGHTWNNWGIYSLSTALSPEIQKRTCKVCGASETKENGKKLKAKATFSASSVVLQVGQKTTAFQVTSMTRGDYVKSWKSSNTKILKVSGKKNGTCTLKAQKKTGKATITVKFASGLTKKINVKVQKKRVETTAIKGLKKSISVKVGKKYALTPVLYPITTTDRISVKISNSKILSVSNKGVIKGKKKGTAKVTLKAGKKSFVVTVKVSK